MKLTKEDYLKYLSEIEKQLNFIDDWETGSTYMECEDEMVAMEELVEEHFSLVEETKQNNIKSQIIVNKDYLEDWYIHSVDKSTPAWTKEHINELFNDFDIFFKDDKNIDFKDLLAFQCSNLNTENNKLLEKIVLLEQQLKAKDKALDKACDRIEIILNYEYEELQTAKDWKEWCENEQ